MCVLVYGTQKICVSNSQGSVYVTPRNICTEMPETCVWNSQGVRVRNSQGSVVGFSNKQVSLLHSKGQAAVGFW